MYGRAVESLQEAGYEQYTAYDFALPGKVCQHHLINWRAPQGEYIGMGPGAFSFVHGHIFANGGDLEKYVTTLRGGSLPVAIGVAIPREEAMARFMVLGLKCLRVNKKAFHQSFGVPLEDYFGPILKRLEAWGLIGRDADEVVLSAKGKIYLGNVSKAFYTPGQQGRRQPRP